jgi:hypothetical protein
MCLPARDDETVTTKDAPPRGRASMLLMAAVMLLACLAGPLLIGAVGAIGAGIAGAGAGLIAAAICAIPLALGRLRRGRA